MLLELLNLYTVQFAKQNPGPMATTLSPKTYATVNIDEAYTAAKEFADAHGYKIVQIVDTGKKVEARVK